MEVGKHTKVVSVELREHTREEGSHFFVSPELLGLELAFNCSDIESNRRQISEAIHHRQDIRD